MLIKPMLLSCLLAGTLFSQSMRIIPCGVRQETGDSVAIVFKVLQDHGQPVHNLGREYVSLRVDGHDIPKFNFEYRSVTTMLPTRIVLVLDASGSMRYGGKIERLKQSAINVIQGMGPTDECAIVAFSTKPVLLTGFSDDKKLLMDKVLGIRPAGYTAMYDAVFDALNQFAAQPQESDRLVLLISDGQEEGKSMFTLADIAPRIYQMGHLTIHTFDLNDKKPSDDLKRLADISGGSYTYDSARDDVFTAFSQFLTQYRKAYVLSYQQPPGLPSQLHKATLLLDVDGVQQQLATEYSDLISETGFVDANPFGVYYAGGLAVLALGIAGAVVLMRKKRQGDRYSGVRMAPTAEPKFALSPPVAPQPEEKTRILGFNIPDEDEKTVILDDLRRRQSALGYLVVQGPAGPGEMIPVDVGELLVGRSAQCRVHFQDPGVSRLHAKIRLENDNLVLYDLGSANGTYVNGEEIQKSVLQHDDVIQVGKFRLRFSVTEPTA